MTQIEDDYWITDSLRIKTASNFQYKYVVKSSGYKDDIWEQGMARVADLAILPLVRQTKGGNVKHVQLYDVWGHFTIKFGVIYPN